jgi:hypothetical protein
MGGLIADAISPGMAFWAFVPLQATAGLLITFVARESLHRRHEETGSVEPTEPARLS